MSKQLTRPIDICDHCDGLFPLVAITDAIKVLRFKKFRDGGKAGPIVRLHHECVEPWKLAKEIS